VDPDRQADIAALDSTLTTVARVLDVDGLRSRIDKLEHEAADPHLWDDQARAQRVTSELSHTQGELRRVEELRRRLDDLPVLYELAAEESGDAAAEAQAAPCSRVNTTSGRRWSPSVPVRAAWTPRTGPRC
jgi:peptide chain release factor 2